MSRDDLFRDVRDDLIYLRKGAGLTDARLQSRTHLLDVLGNDEPPDVARERLLSAIYSLHDKDAELLLGVFAIADETAGMPTLGERRDILGRRLNIRREAVADRDSAALERLLVQLISGWYPKSPLPIPTPVSHNSVVHYAVHTRLVLRDWKLVENLHRYQFFPPSTAPSTSRSTPQPMNM